MAAVARVGASAYTDLYREGPSQEEIGRAIGEVISFLQTKEGTQFAGNLRDFITNLKKNYAEVNDHPGRAFHGGTRAIFTEFFENAEEAKLLLTPCRIFYNRAVDQVSFVDALAQEIMAVGDQEPAVGIAPNDLSVFIDSEGFAVVDHSILKWSNGKLRSIVKREGEDEEYRLERLGPSQEEIGRAIGEVISFLQTEEGTQFARNLEDFTASLKKIYEKAENDPWRAFEEGAKAIFRQFFQKAEEAKLLPIPSRIFYDRAVDELWFVERLAQKIMALPD